MVGLARGLLLLAWWALTFAGLGLLILLIVAVLGVFTKIILLNNTVTFVLGSTVLVLAYVTRWALSGRALRRSFGVGAAAFGWPFLFLGLAPALTDRVPVLWSTEFLHAIYPHVYVTAFPDPPPLEPTLGASLPTMRMGFFLFRSISLNYLQFQLIGHCLISLAIAAAGGLLARTLAAGRSATEAALDESGPAHRPASRATSLGAIFRTTGQALSGRTS